MTEPEIVWEDPPGARNAGRARVVMPWLPALRKRKGKWARVEVADTQTLGQTRRGAYMGRLAADYPDEQWELTVRRLDPSDPKVGVYVRYIGRKERGTNG